MKQDTLKGVSCFFYIFVVYDCKINTYMKRLLKIALLLFVAACTAPAPEPALTLDGDSNYPVATEGGTVTVNFTTNQDDWGFDTGGASWLSASKGMNSLTLTAAANEETTPRSAKIRIFAPATGSPQAAVTVTVSQPGFVFIPTLSLDCGNELTLSAEKQDYPITILTNMSSWEYEQEGTWLKTSASGNILTLSADENTKDVDREAHITVYAPSRKIYEMTVHLSILQKGSDITYELENLSETETSNSYLVTHNGVFEFNATVRGNGAACEGLKAPAALSPAGAKLVWQTRKDLISSVSLEGENIRFETTQGTGNALIAATNASGEIIWSWHIWKPEEEIVGLPVESGVTAMNLNLGALMENPNDVSSYGLLYQWGRKDPLPGSPILNEGTTYTKNLEVYDIDGNPVKIGSTSMYDTKNNTLAYSISHPTVCISNNAQYSTSPDWLRPAESNTALWGNPQGTVREEGQYLNTGTKTFYDPCPVGWRVPDPQTFLHITSSGGFTWATGETEGEMHWYDLGGETEFAAQDLNGDGWINLLDFQNGWHLILDRSSGATSYFPATTRYNGQYAMFMGSMVGLWGNYWSNAPSLDNDRKDTYRGAALAFGIKEYTGEWSFSVSPVSNGGRADAYAIRCIKD